MKQGANLYKTPVIIRRSLLTLTILSAVSPFIHIVTRGRQWTLLLMASILSNTGTTLLSTDPVDPPLHPSNIFCVDGLVVLITGGGTGESMISLLLPCGGGGYGIPANSL